MRMDELMNDLSKQSSFLLAIDGMSGSGKTTLAQSLQEKWHAHVFHMDDFFLPLEMRTPQRLQQPGGNVHYERFLETVLNLYLYNNLFFISLLTVRRCHFKQFRKYLIHPLTLLRVAMHYILFYNVIIRMELF